VLPRPLSRFAVTFLAGGDHVRLARRRAGAPSQIWLAVARNISGGGVGCGGGEFG